MRCSSLRVRSRSASAIRRRVRRCVLRTRLSTSSSTSVAKNIPRNLPYEDNTAFHSRLRHINRKRDTTRRRLCTRPRGTTSSDDARFFSLSGDDLNTIKSLPEMLDGDRLFRERKYRNAASKYERAFEIFERFGGDPRWSLFVSWKRIRADENTVSSHLQKQHTLFDTFVNILDNESRFSFDGVSSSSLRARCYDRASKYALSRNRFQDTSRTSRAAYDLSATSDDDEDRNTAISSRIVSGICIFASNPSRDVALARDSFREAREMIRDDDDLRLRCLIDVNEASLEYASGHRSRAETIWRHLTAVPLVDDEYDSCNVTTELIVSRGLTNLGRSLLQANNDQEPRYEEADEILQRSMRIQSNLLNRISSSSDDISLARMKTYLSYTLAILGGVQHALGKAVTAEGLLRTSTDDMNRLYDCGILEPQGRLVYAESLHVYSTLLGDWEKREGEAITLRQREREILAVAESEDGKTQTVGPGFIIGQYC